MTKLLNNGGLSWVNALSLGWVLRRLFKGMSEEPFRAMVKIMKETQSTKREPNDATARQPLQELRDALLDLHKTLIDSERAVYETNVGPIDSPHHFLQLLSSDPWFAWLRPVSQLIVAMDEALDAREPLTSDSVDALINQSVFVLIPAEKGGGIRRALHGRIAARSSCGSSSCASGQTNRFKEAASVRTGAFR